MSGSPFASTLSVGGFLALAGAGFRPLKQVQGTSVVSLGYQRKPSSHLRGALSPQRIEGSRATGGMSPSIYVPRGALTVQQYLNEGGSFELEERTAAYNNVRMSALARLGDAAREAGALAVVDVRVRRGQFGHAQHAIEFTALGTAVTSDRFEPDEQDPVPLVSISGTAFWALVESGVWPLGVVGGTSVNYVVSGYRTKFARFRLSRRSYRNQEFMDYTEGLHRTRLLAMSRMRHEATELGATGILGISVGRTLKKQRDDDLMMTVDLLGTAVAPLDRAAPPKVAYALGLDKA
jgi:uncharacterized protein YbjQ (UPF0145 family)